MLNKLFQERILILLCVLLASCHDNESNHKNNDTELKSVATVIPNLQMSSSKTIAQNILMDTSFSILTDLLKATDLYEVLTKPGPFTFFAPINNAFRNLPEGTLEGLIKERKNDLVNILSHHIVAGMLQKKDVEAIQSLKTLASDELIVTKRNDEIVINGVKINAAGIKAGNGIIYITNDLFFPKDQNPGAY